MKLRSWACIGLASCLTFFAQRSDALTWRNPPSFDDIVRSATRAFRGEVISVSSRRILLEGSSRRRTLPYTRVRVRVQRAYAGVTEGSVETIRYAGGRISGTSRTMSIPGVPTFRKGELVALFIDDDQPLHHIFGTSFGERGVRRIVADRENYVLTNNWTAVDYTNELLPLHCTPDPKAPDKCTEWHAGNDNVREGSPQPIPEERWVDIMVDEQLDEYVSRLRGSAAASESRAPWSEQTWREAYRTLFESLRPFPALGLR